MSDSSSEHPGKDLLVAFGLGKLEPDEATTIETHLEECAECCETLLDLKEDTFVDLVRQTHEPASLTPAPATERTDGRVDDGSYDATLVLPSGAAIGDAELPPELAENPRYRIVELIGRGGMGDVYKAEHRLMNRSVALKLINQELVRNAQAVERFRREVQAAARLTHPNIVTAYDAAQTGDVHYLVMEYVDGTDLAEVVKEQGPLDVSQACDYIAQAATGLQHAHEQGMVHRDVKPHNLMVTTEGQVKILDFGLATLARDAGYDMPNASPEPGSRGRQSPDGVPDTGYEIRDTSELPPTSRISHPESLHLTTAGTMMGTPDFISPEQAGDARSVDVRSDVYSLGCTLYYLLTGRPPFDEGSVMDRVKAHAERETAPIQTVRVDVPDELDAVIRRMMAKDPSKRFQTPTEVADALAPFVDEHRTGDGRVLGSHRSSGLFMQRPSLVGLYVIGALSTAFVAIYFGMLEGLLSDAPRWLQIWMSAGVKLSLLAGPYILVMADRSERTNSHSAAMSAAWLSLLPLNPVSAILLPVTLWTISVLRRPDIRRAYENNELPIVDSAEARRRRPTIAAIVGTVLLVLVSGIIYVRTDKGTLEIDAPDDSVRIGLSRINSDSPSGDSEQVIEVSFVDTLTGSTLKVLPSGSYLVYIEGDDNEFELSANRFVLKRGGKVVVRVTRRPMQVLVADNVRRAVESLSRAVRDASSDRQWTELIAQHAPLVSHMPFDAARELIRQLTELPRESRETLLRDGYLKWKFASLDRDRQHALTHMLATASMPKNLESLNMDADAFRGAIGKMLESADVGFAAVTLPESGDQAIFWYSLIPASTVPTFFPITGAAADREALMARKEIIQQVWNLQEKSYSNVPTQPPTTNYALQFDGGSTAVSLPIRYDGSHPITLECTVLLKEQTNHGEMLITDTHDSGILLNINPRKHQLGFALRSVTQYQPEVYGDEPFPYGERVHVAGVFNERDVRLFLNGKLVKTAPVSDDFLYEPSPMQLTIGANPDGLVSFRESPVGLIDEVRISKVARYEEDFTPAQRFEPDEHTWALYHFDEGTGTIARDASGNKLDGEIFRATWVSWPSSAENGAQQVASSKTRQELDDLFREARRATTEEQWKSIVAEHAPVLLSVAPADSRELFLLLAGLQEETRDELLRKGYLRWRADDLSQSGQSTVVGVLAALNARAAEADGNPLDREHYQALIPRSDVGFVVLDLPDSDDQAVAWYLLDRQLRMPSIILISGSTVSAIRASINKDVHGQVTALLDKSYSDNVWQTAATPNTVEALDAVVAAAREATTDEQWKELYEQYSPPLAEFPVEVGRDVLEFLGELPNARRAELLQKGYLKWRVISLAEPQQDAIKRINHRITLSWMRDTRIAGQDSDELAKRMATMIELSDVGFAVVEPTPEMQSVVWYLLVPQSPVPMMLPITKTGETAGPGRSMRQLQDQLQRLKDKPYSSPLEKRATSSETRQALDALLAAVPGGPSDDEWKAFLEKHAPLLSEFPAEVSRELIGLTSGLPDVSRESLLQGGYLKWRFTSLDPDRQSAMKSLMNQVLTQGASSAGLDESAVHRVTGMLETADVGFAVLSLPDPAPQMVVWYAQMPNSPVPMMLPICGASSENEKAMLSRSVYKQLSEIEDKPYSDLMPLLHTADMERLQGVWTFIRGEANGTPATPRTLEIAANVWLMKDPQTGRTIERMTFEIEPTQDPKQITITNAAVPQPISAIYRFADDELHITAASVPGGERPKQFNEGGEGRFYVVMRREPTPDLQRQHMELGLRQHEQELDLSRLIPFAVWESNGKAVLRFGNWMLVFEGIDAAPGISGLGALRVPHKRYDDRRRTGGGTTFRSEESPLVLTVVDRIVDEVSTISVNEFEFTMQGRAETLTFGESTYSTTDDVQTIVVRAGGSTRLVTDSAGERGDVSSSIDPSRQPPQSPDEVLAQYLGTWEMELTEKPTPQFTRKITSKHTLRTEPTLGGRMQLSHMTAESGGEEWLIVRTFDRNRQMYRVFLFGSPGVAFERTCQWDSQARTMRHTGVPPVAGVTGSATEAFLDSDTMQTTLRVKNPDGLLTRNVDGIGRRLSMNASIELSVTDTPSDDVPELQDLYVHIGQWNVHCTMRPCVLHPDGLTEERTETGDWILGGRFLRGRSYHADGNLAALYLMTWWPQDKSHRVWHFESDGSIGLWRMHWHAQERTADWQALETPPDWIDTLGSVRFEDDDTSLMTIRIEGQQGRVMMDYEQRRERARSR